MMDFCSDVCFHLQLGLNDKKNSKKCIPENLLLLKCKKGPNWIFFGRIQKFHKIWLIFSLGTLWQKTQSQILYISNLFNLWYTVINHC